jgi:hypothetical protein
METEASAQDSNAALRFAAPVSGRGNPPAAPEVHVKSEHIKQSEKLARLRDAGALIDEEFQARKTEILCRIRRRLLKR